MKNSLVLFLLVTTLFIAPTVMAEGMIEGVQFEGGIIYTTFKPENLNEEIETDNNTIQDYIDNNSSIISSKTFNKMDKMESALGFFIGAKKDFENFKAGTNFERFSKKVEGDYNIELNSGITYERTYTKEIAVNGVVGNISKSINDYVGFEAGLGYYIGSGKFKYNYVKYDSNNNIVDENNPEEELNLENGFGFKIGTNLNYPINSNLNIIGNFNYRNLQLDVENTNDSIDLSGIEFSGGLNYRY